MTLAEREGFEPSRPLRAYGISSAAPSTELGDRSATILATNRQSPSSGGPRLSRQGYVERGVDRATAPRPFWQQTDNRLARAAPRASPGKAMSSAGSTVRPLRDHFGNKPTMA